MKNSGPRAKFLTGRTVALLVATATFAVLALTARRWLPGFFDFADTNAETIEGDQLGVVRPLGRHGALAALVAAA